MIRRNYFIIASTLLSFYLLNTIAMDVSNLKEEHDSATYINLLSIENDLLEQAKPIFKTLNGISKNERIKGLIIHMNCLGGCFGTANAVFNEIKKLKQIKPVIVIIENYCFSGAYYVACAADFIFALPTSEIGAIGVLLQFDKCRNVQFDANGRSGDIDRFVLRIGKYKDLLNAHIPLENWHVDIQKQICQKLYDQFIADVAQARKLSITDEKIWADGQEFVGTDALKLGLIDAVGGFSDALSKMKELIRARGTTVEGELQFIDIKLVD